MSEPGELQGRTALVTGGTRGIGRAVVERLARSGARVVFTGRTAADGAAVEESLPGARFVRADQGSGEDWQDVIEATGGGLDIVVLNAGVSDSASIRDLPLENFRAMCRVNLRGVFLGLKHGVEAIRRKGGEGSVVIVSSIVGKIGVPGYVHYAAAKGGVRLMAKAAALELGPENIRVNSLHPGMVRTDMTAGFPEEVLAPMIPLGRFGEPQEMAAAALFLASDRSRFVTGAELVADGGWIAQ